MILDNKNKVMTRIKNTALNCGRNPLDIKLIAVSKRKPESMIQELLKTGHQDFGENYVQEFAQKAENLAELAVKYDCKWHYIGHLQKNKVKILLPYINLIHTVDRLSLANEIDKRAKVLNKKIDILIQVNIAEEPQKSGIESSNLFDLTNEILKLENINLKGLMTMPPFFKDPEKARPFFKKLFELKQKLQKKSSHITELSMGMSGDMEIAIEEGATMVRVGTSIFGEREPRKI